jgi:hypothetical protein
MRLSVARSYGFNAAHHVPGLAKPWCDPHMHRYTVEVKASCQADEPRMVVDTDRLDELWEQVGVEDVDIMLTALIFGDAKSAGVIDLNTTTVQRRSRSRWGRAQATARRSHLRSSWSWGGTSASHSLISRDVEVCHEIGQSVMLDNGAFSFWRSATPTNWAGVLRVDRAVARLPGRRGRSSPT